MRQEGVDLRLANVLRMADVVMQYEAFVPLTMGLQGASAMVPVLHRFTHGVKEFRHPCACL